VLSGQPFRTSSQARTLLARVEVPSVQHSQWHNITFFWSTLLDFLANAAGYFYKLKFGNGIATNGTEHTSKAPTPRTPSLPIAHAPLLA